MTQPTTATAGTATAGSAPAGSVPTAAGTAAEEPQKAPGEGGRKGAATDTRTPAEIEAQLEATRARLAGRIDDLQAYVTPRAMAQRQLARVRGIYVDEFGGIRPERVLATVGVVAAVVGLKVLLRRRRR